MKKLFAVCAVCALLSPAISMAQSTEKLWGEIHVNSSQGSVSSSPVAGFSADEKIGFGLKLGGATPLENVHWFVGYDHGQRDLSLTNVKLGTVDSNMFSGGVQYRFDGNEFIKPYASLGLHYTRFDGKLANNTMQMKDSANVGAVASVGALVLLDKTSWKNPIVSFINVEVKKPFASSTEVQTVATRARVTDLKFDDVTLSVGVGKNF